MSMLGSKNSLPTLAAARLPKWAVLLLAYQYDLEFRMSEQHCNADALSHLPRLITAVGKDDTHVRDECLHPASNQGVTGLIKPVEESYINQPTIKCCSMIYSRGLDQ